MTDTEELADLETANAVSRALEYLYGKGGIWETDLTWEHQREAVREVQRLIAIKQMHARDLPKVR